MEGFNVKRNKISSVIRSKERGEQMKNMETATLVNPRTRCYEIVDMIPEEQLGYVLTMLENTHKLISDTLDDAFCLELYRRAKSAEDNASGISLAEYAEQWGIDIESADYAD